MKRGDKVRVKVFARVPYGFQGRFGTVTADSTLGHAISVELEDEAVTHDFMAEDLERVE